MDPLTILGAAAASMQLAEQVCCIVEFFFELYGKAKEAPELIQARLSHLEQLISVSKLIARTEQLQTTEIQKALVACLRYSLDLRQILNKFSAEEKGKLRRTLQSLKVAHKEDRITKLLDKIEREKSSLAICLHQVSAVQLQSLNLVVSEVQTALGKTAIMIEDTATNIQTLVDIAPEMATQVQILYDDVPRILGRIQDHLVFTKSLNSYLLLLAFVVWIMSLMVAILRPNFAVDELEQALSPMLYEVPNKRVKNFVGRDDELARIGNAFASPSHDTPIIAVIRAMGGQGKTQVALEYCRRRRDTANILWIDATSEDSLASSFASLSQVIDPSSNPALDRENRMGVTRRSLAASSNPWLVVFDNYDDPSSYDIRNFIPESPVGMVIITSRHKDCDYLADEPNRIELHGLDDGDAIRLLLLQSGLNNSDTASAKKIVTRLAHHPLAITQAGVYIKMRRLRLEDFLNEYSSRRKKILKDTTPQMSEYRKTLRGTDKDVMVSLFTTFEFSFQHLLILEKERQGNLTNLLTLLAFFHSGHIHLDLFYAYCAPDFSGNDGQVLSPDQDHKALAQSSIKIGHPQPNEHSTEELDNISHGPGAFICTSMGQWDPENLSDAFILLSQLSLAELSFQPVGDQFGYVSLHPLVRDWIRLRTPRDACPGYSSLAATCIFRLLLSKREINRIYYEEPTARQRLADHVKTYTNNIVKFSSGQNSTAFEVPYDDSGRPALEFAFLLHAHGQFSRSEAWYRQSLAMRTAQFGLGDPLTLNSLNNLSTILHLQQKYVEATHIRKKILDIKARIFGEADSATWAARMDLAGALASQGLYTEAEGIMRGILDFRQRIYGDKNLETIIAMDELRRVLLHQGKMEEAENLHRQALSLAKEVAGPTHLITLTLTESLEIYLLFPGKYPDAENMMRKGLKDEQNTPRADDPILEKMREVALASFLSTKRFGSTEWGLHKVNVNFVQNTDGEVDIDKLMAMGYLGVLFQMLHLHAVAERLQRKCLELKVEVFGAESVLTLKEMNNLALSLTHQRKYEEAELLWEMAVTWAQKFLASDDPDLENFEGNLREIRYDRERRDAEKFP